MNAPRQPVAPADSSTLQGFTPRRLVELLWPKAAAQLSRADLLAIIDGGSDYTTEAADNAGRVVEGLACLVLHDGQAWQNDPGAGNFQDAESVGPLLFHLQAQFEALAAVSAAVGYAASELTVRDNP